MEKDLTNWQRRKNLSELSDRLRKQERESYIRAQERLREADAIFLDSRPQMARDAFERDNQKAKKFCKAAVGVVVFCLFVWSLFFWFGR